MDGSASRTLEPPKGGGFSDYLELVLPTVLLSLPADVLADHALVSAHRGHEVPPCPEMLPDKVPLPPSERPCDMNRALPLDVPDHLGHRVLRWDRDHHVDMIGQQMPLLDPALSLLRQATEHFPQVPPYLPEYALLSVLRNENDMILTLPLRVT